MKEIRKVGICTFYHNVRNYGANLQAYALQKNVQSMGYEAKLVSYYNNTKLHGFLSKVKQSLLPKDKVAPNIAVRNRAVDAFNQSIPHTQLYYRNTIGTANENFDCFITGSDQVWNPDWIQPCFSLAFADKDKRKIAYAASTGTVSLTEEQKKKLSGAVDATDYISIREDVSIPAVQELTGKKVEYVLDPTLLLTQAQWNEICSQRIINEDYLFCYFLGDNENLRTVARQYAMARRLKLVTLPYLNGQYRKVDEGFGDYGLYDISPTDLLSLIRNASFVMTDSFHAAVFSHIYEKEFLVSGNRNNPMNCRLQSLTELFGTENRYFNDHGLISLDSLKALERTPMNLNWECWQKMCGNSLNFLRKALKDD